MSLEVKHYLVKAALVGALLARGRVTTCLLYMYVYIYIYIYIWIYEYMDMI